MPPQPKRKLSKGRRNRRRAHDALEASNLVACPNCGFYKGREVIAVKKAEKKK
jgi:large subunit ribosomal protein L32